jgi:hypothetical protein
MGILVFIEAMHLLPQSFDFRRPTPPPRARLSEQRRSSSQPLFGSFRKACRTSSRGRLFRFGQGQSRERPLASRQHDHHNADQSSPINPGRLIDHEALGRIWQIPAALTHPEQTDQNE